MAPSTSNLVGHPWENVFPTASSPFVSPGKYGPNFTATYESCGGDCAAARDGASSVMPTAMAPRTPMTDFEFIDDPFNEFRPGPPRCAGPPDSQGKPSSLRPATCVDIETSSVARRREQTCGKIRVKRVGRLSPRAPGPLAR